MNGCSQVVGIIVVNSNFPIYVIFLYITNDKIVTDQCLYTEKKTFINVIEFKRMIFKIFVCLSVRLLSLISELV